MENIVNEDEFCTINGQNFSTESIKEVCLVESRNCLSVSNMLVKLSWHNSQYVSFEEQAFAEEIYQKSKTDLVDMGMKQHIYFVEGVFEPNVEALMAVVHYVRTKLQCPWLVVLACMKLKYFHPDIRSEPLTFVRVFHLPCK